MVSSFVIIKYAVSIQSSTDSFSSLSPSNRTPSSLFPWRFSISVGRVSTICGTVNLIFHESILDFHIDSFRLFITVDSYAPLERAEL